MKSASERARKERITRRQRYLDEKEFRTLIGRIRNNAQLTRILLQLEKPIRADFYRKALPFLRGFTPIPLEAIE